MNMKQMRTCSFPHFTITFCLLIVTLGGCSYLFYPKASTYLEQAKGSSGVETMENLIGMLEKSAKAARAPQNHQAGVDDLHNQLHALDDAFCQVTKPQTETAAYSKATTLRKELWTIFKRTVEASRRSTGPRGASRSVQRQVTGLRESLRALKG